METKFSKMAGIDKAIMVFVYVILFAFMAAIIVPMVYIVLASFIDPITLQNQGLTFDFSKWTLTAYERVMSNSQIWIGFKNALIYSVLSTIIAGVVTLLAAYPMSRPDFKGRGFFNTIYVITMYFGGGLIPTYLVVKQTGLIGNMWSLFLPGGVAVGNMIIVRNYFTNSIPHELGEAAEIDGCSKFRTFISVVIPLSMPILAVMAVFSMVAYWNDWFTAMIYLGGKGQPLPLVLRGILIKSSASSAQASLISGGYA